MIDIEARDSQLFTLRLWPEEDMDGHIQWRGKLHHVTSGQIRHFRDWPALIPLLLSLLPKEVPPAVPLEPEPE